MQLTRSGLAARKVDGSQRASRVPGEPGIWVFIFGDLVIFAYIFLLYLHHRSRDPELFARAQRDLSTDVGVAYTLLLLTSSLFVVFALRMIRVGNYRTAPRLVVGAMACGVAFASIKALEYYVKVHAGITPATNDFDLFYYILTGLHLVHVAIGLGVLSFMWWLARRAPALSPLRVRLAEACACFWHMVDLLWLVIFPLLYLVR